MRTAWMSGPLASIRRATDCRHFLRRQADPPADPRRLCPPACLIRSSAPFHDLDGLDPLLVRQNPTGMPAHGTRDLELPREVLADAGRPVRAEGNRNAPLPGLRRVCGGSVEHDVAGARPEEAKRWQRRSREVEVFSFGQGQHRAPSVHERRQTHHMPSSTATYFSCPQGDGFSVNSPGSGVDTGRWTVRLTWYRCTAALRRSPWTAAHGGGSQSAPLEEITR